LPQNELALFLSRAIVGVVPEAPAQTDNGLVVAPDVRPSGGVGLTSDEWLTSGHLFFGKKIKN
jgi:hypothetical protein